MEFQMSTRFWPRSDEEMDAVRADAGRTDHVGRGGDGGGDFGGGDGGGEVRLADHYVRSYTIGGGDGVIDENAVGRGVGDKQFTVLDPDALGAVEGLRGYGKAGGSGSGNGGSEVGLADHHVGGLTRGGRGDCAR